MDKKEIVCYLDKFALYHAKGDLPHSARTVQALQEAITLIEAEIQKEELQIMEQGTLRTYDGVSITHEDLDLIQEAIQFYVESSGHYISYDEERELQIRARKTLEKFGLRL